MATVDSLTALGVVGDANLSRCILVGRIWTQQGSGEEDGRDGETAAHGGLLPANGPPVVC